MAVDTALFADLALGAMKAPRWKAPPATLFGPEITLESQERLYHPLVKDVQASLVGLSSAAQRQNVLSARVAWVTARKVTAETALNAIGVAPSLPASLARTPVTTRTSSSVSMKRPAPVAA